MVCPDDMIILTAFKDVHQSLCCASSSHHPHLLALPITRRPLFPGFYKAIIICNPAVVSAVKEMMK
jgi:hypothetical protein